MLETRLRVTVGAPVRCNAEPPCVYCCNASVRGSQEEADLPTLFAALDEMGREYGPCEFIFAYGEPLSSHQSILGMAVLAQENVVKAVSNLVAHPTDIMRFATGKHVAICASYHPHLWGGPYEFVERYQWCESLGIAMDGVIIVAYPPNLQALVQARSILSREGIHCITNPYYGVWQGREYPVSYSSAERMLVGVNGDTAWREPNGRLCRAGMDYVYVKSDGEVLRCWDSQASLGNIIHGTFEPHESAQQCCAERCVCSQLWEYMEETNGGNG